MPAAGAEGRWEDFCRYPFPLLQGPRATMRLSRLGDVQG